MSDPNQSGRQIRERIADLEIQLDRTRLGAPDEYLAKLRLLRELKLQLRDLERAEWGD